MIGTKVGPTASGLDVQQIRADFPILASEVHGKPLVYLDNAATSQKPRAVIQAIKEYYERDNSNVHRGVHSLSERATEAYEAARRAAAGFVNSASEKEIVFVRGATEAINLVAHSFVKDRLSEGDEVVVSALEHHSNIVPWQLVCEEKGARLRVIPMHESGELDLDALAGLLSERTKFVTVNHVSNALGTVNDVKDIIAIAHDMNVPVLIDGAQRAPHGAIDVADLDCDFYAVSGHKMFGPTGIGFLYGKKELLEGMRPYQGGGEMIESVTFERSTFAEVPARFEAGTPNIAGAVGLKAAIEYLQKIDWVSVNRYEKEILDYAIGKLSELPNLRIIGTPKERGGVVSFVMDDVHPHDIGTIVDQEGVAIRTGHHCAQPVMDFYGVPATARASFAFYNTTDDVDRLVDALQKVREMFGNV